MKVVALLAAGLLLATAAVAARSTITMKPAAPTSAPAIDVRQQAAIKRQLVLELLRITNAEQQARDMLDSMTQMLPEPVREVLQESLNPAEMVRLVVPVYEQYLAVEDLKAIIAFYRTPAGKKLLTVQPLLVKDAMVVMKVYAQDKIEAALKAEGT